MRLNYKFAENKRKAREYFGIVGKTNLVLHHKDVNLRHTDYKRYCEWRPEDLVVMTRSEHTKLHNLIKKENGEYKKVSATLTGRPHTEEHKKHIGDFCRGKHWKVENGKRVWY